MNSGNRHSLLRQTRITLVCALFLLLFNTEHILSCAIAGWPGDMASLMQFDRELIFKGEIWRLITCHFVHWSLDHFLLDALVFLALGITFEQNIGRKYLEVLVLSGLMISLSLLFFQWDLDTYRGISGLINTQFLLGTGLFMFNKNLKSHVRYFYTAIFCIHVFKTTFEMLTGSSFFHTNALGQMGAFTPLAHLTGALVGFWFLYFMSFRKCFLVWFSKGSGQGNRLIFKH